MAREYSDFIRTVRSRKGFVVLCFVVILTALLVCCHREFMDSLRSLKRRAEVRAVMNAYGRESGRRYRVRGPLTVAQVEQELFGRALDSNSTAKTSEGSDSGRLAWRRMKSDYRDGDELYFVNSDERSWAHLAGWRGYVLIRQNKVVDGLTTFMN